MPAKPENLHQLQACVMDTVGQMGASSKGLFRIEFALEEILSNVNKYAYADGEGDVEVECRIEPKGVLRISIRDWGAPFDPTACPTPDICQDACERPLGGMGVFLTRQLAGELIYERLPDGNRLTILFQI
ncbi:MAG: ATP-binding protein [Syntrophobacteraceae bacterium]|jgi:sigma-B regulation protein RsbU (phosphoserine phosphatase)|nr:ATP-binding protein [Syntrophobacteraceae bacterium]